MTRLNPLVLDGSTVKLRLQADRAVSPDPVHVDWVRFTVQRRNGANLGDIDAVWTDSPQTTDDGQGVPVDEWASQPVGYYANSTRYEFVMWEIMRNLRELPGEHHTAAIQAADLGREVVECLGPEFRLNPEIRKGHDFYRHRLSILRADVEVGWIGFLASGDSPRQTAQSATLHCNLFGAACTFGQSGWRDKLADVIDQREGVVTRVDLALDYFDGLPGGMAGIVGEYEAGAMDVRGARPAYDQVGRWLESAPCSRSFYFGSKQAGKQTNVYEKGDQLFGPEAHDPWLRVELRYGNKLRVIPSDALRRPGDFFAGASDWHAAKLASFASVNPQAVRQTKRLQGQTVEAEVSRVVRWARQTAGAAIAALARFMPGDGFLDFAHCRTVPGRLQRFTESDLRGAFNRLFTPVSAGPALVAG